MKKQIITLAILVLSVVVYAQESSATRTLKLDYNQSTGKLNTMFKECVGAGRANEGLRADWQQQLAYVKKQCGFKYIRMHGLLTDDMGVYTEDKKGNPIYNYMYVDALFDYLLSIDIKPFVELGFMPNALASGNQTIFWWKGNVTPPKDYNKWEAFIKNMVQHFTDRYGEKEVKSWYFEVWNEPNLTPAFWSSTQEEYFKLYQYSASAIKSVNKAYKVGGPGTAGAAWETEMIDFCKKNNVPIDFVSTHSYGVGQGFLDEYGQNGTILSKDPMAVSGDVLQSRKEMEMAGLPNLELHYTEWSASYTPADPIHDSYHEAAYILEKLKQAGNAAQSMSYWVFTDIFEEPGPRNSAFHGGFGLISIQGINKPAFYSYQFLNQLGTTELKNNDTRSWVTKNANGDVQLLLWDYTYTLPEATNNQDFYNKDLPAKQKGKVKINFSNIPQGNYKMELRKVGYRANDAFTAYIDMGSPTSLSKQQVESLKKQTSDMPASTESIKINSKINFVKEIELKENDVYLITLVKK